METINNTDRKPALFIGDRELTFFQRVATEVVECVTRQKIRYYAIDSELTKADDLYNESTSKVFRQPIEVYALVMYDEPTVRTGTFSTEMTYAIRVYIQRFRVEQDLKVSPRMGDFLEFGQKYFEVTKVWYPQLIAGLDTAGFQMGCYVEAVSTRADVFSPHKLSKYQPNNPDVIR